MKEWMNIEVYLTSSHYFEVIFMMVVEWLSLYKENSDGYKYMFYQESYSWLYFS